MSAWASRSRVWVPKRSRSERDGAFCTPLQLATECLSKRPTKIKNPLNFAGFQLVPESFQDMGEQVAAAYARLAL